MRVHLDPVLRRKRPVSAVSRFSRVHRVSSQCPHVRADQEPVLRVAIETSFDLVREERSAVHEDLNPVPRAQPGSMPCGRTPTPCTRSTGRYGHHAGSAGARMRHGGPGTPLFHYLLPSGHPAGERAGGTPGRGGRYRRCSRWASNRPNLSGALPPPYEQLGPAWPRCPWTMAMDCGVDDPVPIWRSAAALTCGGRVRRARGPASVVPFAGPGRRAGHQRDPAVAGRPAPARGAGRAAFCGEV